VNAWADARALTSPWLPSTRAWLGEAGPAIALAINSAACLLDLQGVIIDGSFSRELLQALMPEVERALDRYSWEGVARPGAGRHHRQRCPRHRRRAVAAVRELRARPGSLSQDRQDGRSGAMKFDPIRCSRSV
jgi:hypothetical protein